MNDHCRHWCKHLSEHGALQEKIDSPPLSGFFSCSRLCVFPPRGSTGISFCLSTEVTTAETSALVFSLTAAVFLCLDDGLDFPLDSGCELVIILQARGRDALLVCKPHSFLPMWRGSFGQICPEC